MTLHLHRFALSLLMLALLGPTLFAQPDTEGIKKFRIINIGFVVNTGDLEYAPTITADRT